MYESLIAKKKNIKKERFTIILIGKHFYKENEPYQRNWHPLDSLQCVNSPICLVFFNILSISNIDGVNASGLKNVTLGNESFRFLEINL